MHNGYPILSILIFLPLAGGLLLIPFWKREKIAKSIAIAISFLELVLVCRVWNIAHCVGAGSAALRGFFLAEDAEWISRFGIRYTLGMDGISLLLCMLTAFTIVITMLVAWRSVNKHGTL